MGLGTFIKTKLAERSAAREQDKDMEVDIKPDEVFGDVDFQNYYNDVVRHDASKELDATSNTYRRDLKALHETFTKKQETVNKAKVVLKQHIAKEIGADVLKEADLAAIETYINKEAVENPEQVLDLLTKLQKFEKTRAEIKKHEDIIKKHGTHEQAAIKFKELKEAQGVEKRTWFRDLTPTKQRQEAMKEQIQAEYGIAPNQIPGKIRELERDLPKLKESEGALRGLSEKFKELRQDIFDHHASVKDLHELAGERVLQKMKDLESHHHTLPAADKHQALSQWEEAQKLFDTMTEADDSYDSGSKPDYFKKFTATFGPHAASKSDVENWLDHNISEAIAAKIAYNVSHNEKPSDIENAMRPLLNRSIGKKSGVDARQFVIDEVKKVATAPTTTPAKRHILNRLIVKYTK